MERAPRIRAESGNGILDFDISANPSGRTGRVVVGRFSPGQAAEPVELHDNGLANDITGQPGVLPGSRPQAFGEGRRDSDPEDVLKGFSHERSPSICGNMLPQCGYMLLSRGDNGR